MKYSCIKTFLIFLLYLFFGHSLFSMININDYFVKNNIIGIIIVITYFLFDIANLFFIIYINIMMLIPYYISQGFYSFIFQCANIGRNIYLAQIFFKTLILILFFFFGGFFYTLYILKEMKRRYNYDDSIIIIKSNYYFISFFFFLIFFFPFIFISNLFTIILALINFNNVIIQLNNVILNSIGYSFNLNN